eukprot:CAMPEP_0175071662 /NCGR_PEP_ID=MMETSP0052_2-20121109/19370_1 /TAXON_ID=51329 ORGANISM="Polytomella parva, Strain SAG 63-3" /NCGR_SAMPLE_ID=MMETSP0052_2 /ASSEMBLY_ACC=CAM_ASM_000194 /LENGTH=205 /DNA_ID=CAMNT_0016338863 /DNA_START=178 /DNA_END=795 /DNA_ORIENTATION=-
MKYDWPTYLDSNDDFWSHEWERHGTCAQDVLGGELDYFRKIIHLHEAYDLEAALRKADIRPRHDVLYSSEGIANAIKKQYGVRPLVHCWGGNLTEIWMCVDKSLKPYDCELDKQQDTCKWVKIPPFHHSPAALGDSELEFFNPRSFLEAFVLFQASTLIARQPLTACTIGFLVVGGLSWVVMRIRKTRKAEEEKEMLPKNVFNVA